MKLIFKAKALRADGRYETSGPSSDIEQVARNLALTICDDWKAFPLSLERNSGDGHNGVMKAQWPGQKEDMEIRISWSWTKEDIDDSREVQDDELITAFWQKFYAECFPGND